MRHSACVNCDSLIPGVRSGDKNAIASAPQAPPRPESSPLGTEALATVQTPSPAGTAAEGPAVVDGEEKRPEVPIVAGGTEPVEITGPSLDAADSGDWVNRIKTAS